MTRINIVEPVELTDQHLIAEYREIFMIGSSLQRSLASPNWDINSIPKEYTLNKGHVKFFYNKGKYLHWRYLMLIEEMENRGFNPDMDRQFKSWQFPDELYNDWAPTEKDRNVARQRINARIAKKPQWYKYYSEPYLYGHYVDIGYNAYKNGIRYNDDSPEYVAAILADATGVINSPNDDFNQGWLKAHCEEKSKNE